MYCRCIHLQSLHMRRKSFKWVRASGRGGALRFAVRSAVCTLTTRLFLSRAAEESNSRSPAAAAEQVAVQRHLHHLLDRSRHAFRKLVLPVVEQRHGKQIGRQTLLVDELGLGRHLRERPLANHD